jgi:hypothetical protein
MSQTRARYRPICVGVMRPTCVDPEYISVGGFLVPAARASAEPDTAISTTLAAHNAQIAFVRVTASPHAYRISTLPRRRSVFSGTRSSLRRRRQALSCLAQAVGGIRSYRTGSRLMHLPNLSRVELREITKGLNVNHARRMRQIEVLTLIQLPPAPDAIERSSRSPRGSKTRMGLHGRPMRLPSRVGGTSAYFAGIATSGETWACRKQALGTKSVPALPVFS